MMLRALPSTQPRWSCDADVVVVGSGAAGMAAALAAAAQTTAARGRRVLLLSKNELGMKEFGEWYQTKFAPLVQSGKREIFTILE